MNQILHILKKDIRCFRVEIVLVFLCAVLAAWNGIPRYAIRQPEGLSELFWIVGTLLITRVIHAEAIPGSKLFWLTRPYRWKSLLAEKLLFLFLFVGLPPALVNFVSLERAGFSLAEFLPSLLLREVMICLAWIVPVAGLAAVTENLKSFLVGLLFVWAMTAPLTGLLCCSTIEPFPNAMTWIPASFAALLLTSGAAVILFLQYKRRQTVLGRALATVSVILAGVMVISTPFSLGMQVQSLFSRADIDHSSMAVSVENDHGGFLVAFKGTPPGLNAHFETLVGEVVGNDGKAAAFSGRDTILTTVDPTGTMRMLFAHDADIARFRGKPVTLRGSVYVTLFTAPRSWQQDFPAAHERVVDGIRCGRIDNALACRALLDSSPGTLSVRRADPLRDWWKMGTGSYAPFPKFDLRPYEELLIQGSVLGVSSPQSERQLRPNTLELRYSEPVSHFWLNFDIPVASFLE